MGGAVADTAVPIEFEGLVKRFRSRTVIDDLSFSVPRGSIVGLLGPNGAGKSTAMRVLLGLQRPTAGHARILGHAAGSPGFREATRRVGAIIEAPPLYKNATARQNLEIRAAAIGLTDGPDQVLALLHRVGLGDRADDPVGSFSLGMRQRVGVALTLMGDPEIVVLDEPTNGLDPEGALEVRNLVRSLPERGATTLLCTHRLAEVEATCDYVVVLQAGRLVTQGTLADVIAQATSSGLAIRVADADAQRALAIVGSLGLGDVRLAGGEIVTTVVPGDPAVVTRRLADEGIYLSGLNERRATLEEAFLKLTHADADRGPQA
jgi:ABC-type multidrug transport system ATPase subunit